MATIIVKMAEAVTTSSDIGESLSGIFGCISLVAWICLLVSFLFPVSMGSCAASNIPKKLPQLVTNYKAQSADGLSMGFLFIWLLGDITNLAGT